MATLRQLDRYLPTLAIIVSLALTALTITAVIRQGRTIETRELIALEEDAQREMRERTNRFMNDMNGWMTEVAAIALEGRDALDNWTTRHQFLRFIALTRSGDALSIYPLTPTEAPLPYQFGLDTVLEQREFGDQSLHAKLRFYEALTEFESPQAQADTLLIIASLQRKLGAKQAAAATYGQAADLMQTHPRSIRGAFGARIAAFDCLAQRGDRSAAQRELERLSKSMVAAHVAAWGRGEYAMVQRRWNELAREPVNIWDEMLRSRARNRDAVDEIERAFYRYGTPDSGSPSDLRFAMIERDSPEPLIMGLQRIEPGWEITLVSSLDDVIERYWEDASGKRRWRVVPADDPTADDALITLPDAFGAFVVTPAPELLLQLQGDARRRILLLVSVTIGTLAAWGVVIWLILRGLANQRELVSLQRRFMADVSHELKTPLALIRLHAETLSEGRLRDESRRHAYHQTIARESERLTLLLDNILDFSRIEAGRKEYEFAACNIGSVVLQAWNLFKPRFLSEGFECKVHIADELPELVADEQAIQQVVINLLQNAFRYGAKGLYVSLRVTRKDKHIRISIQDHGIGMSKSQIRRLGALFERGADPEVRKTRGTGLGLAIVKHIVSAHGGQLEVLSELGSGSTFTVILPLERSLEASDL